MQDSTQPTVPPAGARSPDPMASLEAGGVRATSTARFGAAIGAPRLRHVLARRWWLACGTTVAAVVVLGAVAWGRSGPRAVAAVGSLALVERTTVLALRGEVQHQPLGATSFEPVQGTRTLQVGDRVRTGGGGYASIVFFDGSTTALEPETEIILQRFERDPTTGATAVIVQQPLGTTWTQAAASGHPFSGFLLASTAGRFFARGSQFTTAVAPEGAMAVTAIEGALLGRADGRDVDVPAGFTARVQPNQSPERPEPTGVAATTLQVRIDGPLRVLITDGLGRSVGYHPEAEPYVSQIPGARLLTEDGAQVIVVPAPVDRYDLTLRGTGVGDVTVAVGVLRGGDPTAPAAVRLSGKTTAGAIQATGFLWRDGQIRDARALEPATGPPAASKIAVLRHPPPALVLAATSTPAPMVQVEEADPTAVASRVGSLEPDADDVFSSLDAPMGALRPAVVAPVAPTRPAVVTAPAPPPIVVRSASDVARAPERVTRPPVVSGLPEGDDGLLALAPTPTVEIRIVTATPVPPTAVPPTPVPATATPRPPPTVTPLPTVPPTIPPPVPTTAAPRAAAPRPVGQGLHPAIAPTATPYAAPTRCLYGSC